MSQLCPEHRAKRIPWIIKILYLNPHFPYPEYNFARLAVIVAYLIWGTVLLLPDSKYAFFSILELIAPKKLWAIGSIFMGLFSFWRLAEFKEPTIFCSWINLFVASSWWAFCILMIFSIGFIPLSIAGDIVVALLATYVYLFADVRYKADV